jgi:hypothetical protein
MKSLPLISLFCLLLAVFSCTQHTQQTSLQSHNNDSLAEYPDSIAENPCILQADTCLSQTDTLATQQSDAISIKNDHLAKYRDTIVGNFSGSQIDTLISEPIGSMDDEGYYRHWKVFAKNGSVDEVLIDNTIYISFVSEGDLDGDGADEWGYIPELEVGAWWSYKVYTYKNKKGRYLIEPFTIWCYHLFKVGDDTPSTSVDDLVRKHSSKSVRIRYSDIRIDDDLPGWVLVDTIVPIIR